MGGAGSWLGGSSKQLLGMEISLAPVKGNVAHQNILEYFGMRSAGTLVVLTLMVGQHAWALCNCGWQVRLTRCHAAMLDTSS